MSFAEGNTRKFFFFSTLVSFLSLVAAIVTRRSSIAILVLVFSFIAHLPLLWIVQPGRRSGRKLLAWSVKPGLPQAIFLVGTSLLSTSLGFLSWIFLFEPGSLVRQVLIQASPVIGWCVVLVAYLVTASGAALSDEVEKRDGSLLGAVLFSVIGHLFLFWLSAQIFSFTIDDAYITFRYSKNLAAGFGPTYNPGLPPVEGYTTFLWMLIMTLPHFIGMNVATFSKIVGIFLACGTLGMVSLLTFTLTRGYPARARLFFAAFATFLLAMLPITSIHAIAGMETTLFTFLIALMVYLVTLGLLDGSRLLLWSPLVGLLVGLTRPEGNAISLLVLTCGWLFSTPALRQQLTWRTLLLYVLPGAAYFIWRFTYYDLPFPLPFYMKVLHGSGLFGGASEVGTYLLYLLPSISVLLLGAILRLRKEFFAVLAPVVFLLIFYLFPVHAMGFNWRFIYPATPFITVLVAIGGMTIFELLRGLVQSSKRWEPALMVGLFLVSLGNLGGLEETIRNQNFYGAGISTYKNFGTLLSEFNNRHEMTIAIGDAGTIPYYSDWQVIDLFGLNSTEVAFGTVPIYELIFDVQSADLVILSVGANPNRISDEHAGAQALYEEATRRGMTRLGTFSWGRVNNIWVVGYPDSELAAYLQKNMEFREQP